MDTLWIDLKFKNIFYKINRGQEPILKKNNGDVKGYCLEEKDFERLIAIIKKKDKNESELSDKIEIIERGMKKLMMQMEVLLTKSKETFY